MKALSDLNGIVYGVCTECGGHTAVCAVPGGECDPPHAEPVHGCPHCKCDWEIALDDLLRLLGAPVLPGFEG